MRNQAEANLSALIESTEDLIWSVDRDYRLVTFNRALQQAFEKGFGITPVAGMLPTDLLPPERAAIFPPLYERVLAEGPFRTEYNLRDGRTLEMSLNPIVVEGKTTGISVFGKDMTERKLAEQALLEAERRYRDIFDRALEGMFQTTAEGRSLTANSALARMLGYDSPEDVIASVTDAARDVWVDPQDRARYVRLLEEHGTVLGFESQYKRKDGSVIWVSVSCRKVSWPDGRTRHFQGFIEDITERKRVEMAHLDSEERFRETFEQAAVGIVHATFEGRILRCNRRFAEIIAYPLGEIPGKTFQQITPPEHLKESEGILEQLASNSPGTQSWEKCYIRKDGSLTWVRLTSSVQRDGEGRPLHLVTFVEDINARKAAEQQLLDTQEELRGSEARYRTVFQASLDGISISRRSDGRYLDVNERFLEIVGFTREEVIGSRSLDLGLWENPSDRVPLIDALRRDLRVKDMEARFKRKDGQVVWVLLSVSVIQIEGLSCILSVMRDISATKDAELQLVRAQEALRTSEERYRTVFQTSLDPVTITVLSDGRYVDVNPAFLNLLGFERGELVGRTVQELNIWVDQRDRQNLVEILRLNSYCRNIEARFRKKNGEIFWVLLSASVIEIEGVACLLGVIRDLSDAKAAEDEIRMLVFYDPLTRLPNRRLLLDRLRQSLAAGIRDRRKQGLLFVDLDHFKTLNETLGHQAGDLLLQEVARRIAACVSEADTVARLGGDEFVVLLEGLSEFMEDAAEQTGHVAGKIIAAAGEPYLLGGREYHISFSIGITVFGDQSETAHEILQQAEIAMYQAKAAGRNTMSFFAPALQAAVNARAAMEDDLRQAIKTGEFALYYQPQVDSNGLIGAEALVRWNHPERGLLAPNDFIGLAEETGLILPLGEWVLETTCKQISAWAHRRETAHIALAVNISARQFRQPEFVDQVLAVLYRTGANPRNLKLELTESILLENVEDVIEKMSALKSHGLRFSLDDFGTGYSSLSYLKRLPLDQLKIDRAFVRDILVDFTSGAIAQTIVSLSRAMGLSVIAEGVETDEQRQFLTVLGCHSFQGYLFSPPLPLEEFERLWLAPLPQSV
jgi:diguanylate cyclase (GGDEF)-like protein/PAS domain S-box-containing protein